MGFSRSDEELSWQLRSTAPSVSCCGRPAQRADLPSALFTGLSRRQLFPTFLWSTSPFENTFQCFPSLFQHEKGLLWGSNIIISQGDIVCSALGQGVNDEWGWMSNFGPPYIVGSLGTVRGPSKWLSAQAFPPVLLDSGSLLSSSRKLRRCHLRCSVAGNMKAHTPRMVACTKQQPSPHAPGLSFFSLVTWSLGSEGAWFLRGNVQGAASINLALATGLLQLLPHHPPACLLPLDFVSSEELNIQTSQSCLVPVGPPYGQQACHGGSPEERSFSSLFCE